MSEYKNDEMETHIMQEGGLGPRYLIPKNLFSKKPGKLNEHLKLVVNNVDNSVSIYNSISQRYIIQPTAY